MTLELLILMVAFQIKHFICDYPLQNAYMLQKGSLNGWVKPLVAHSAVHSLGTILVVSFYSLKLGLILGLIDLVLHFIVDRIKASPKIGGKYNPSQPYFWWALGLDQMAHHIINCIFIFIILGV